MTENDGSPALIAEKELIMEELYSRTKMLIGDGVEKLKAASVIVFGCGGVGSYAVEALARAGIGHIAVVDADTVAPSNLNRQLIATADTVGRPKAEVERERILSVNPECNVEAFELFYGAETAHLIDLTKYDYVCDAIDSVTSKLLLAVNCKEAGVPIISSMGTGNKLDPSAFKITDISKTSVCPLAKVMRRELKARGISHMKVLYSEEKPKAPHLIADEKDAPAPGKRSTPASISFVPGTAGLMIAGEIICDLAGIER